MRNRWEDVFAAHYARLVVLVTAVCGSSADAEEAVQEAFVRALAHDGSDERINDPLAWLYRVARNVALSRFRRIAVAVKHAPVLHASDHTPSADDRVDDRLYLMAELRRLPLPQREALVLFHMADWSIEAIAQQQGVPTGTVKARLARGRAAIARTGPPVLDDVEGVTP
jgi:RNA polymerase sigma-70 factor (ECF subfamily)